MGEHPWDPFDLVSPLDFRYPGVRSARFRAVADALSERASVRAHARVEAALVAVLADAGIAPPEAAAEAARAAEEITPQEVYEEEARSEHNIRALVECMRRRMSPAHRRYVHLFATSADIMDTARALMLRDAADTLVLPSLKRLHDLLVERARRWKEVVQIGRTHGQWAEPTTFGYALALYVARLGGRIEALHRAAHALRGKFAGAVGTYAAASLGVADPPALERALMDRLGLPAPEGRAASQIAEPEPWADFAHAMASAFGVLANLADDIRHLMRSEISEVAEPPSAERVGSSTMPHKVNPKDYENVKSLWKAFVPRVQTAYLDQISEHQRDLTNSASMRFLVELVAALAYSADRLERSLARMEIREDAMRGHLARASAEITAEPLYIVLALAGHADAYETVRRIARDARARGEPVLAAARRDAEIARILDRAGPDQRRVLEDPSAYIGVAVRRTEEVCAYWEDAIARMIASCPAALKAAGRSR